LDAKPKTSTGDRLDVLVILLEVYWQEHYRVDPPDPIEAIKFRMELLEVKPSDLAKILGGRSHVSQVLTRRENSRLKTMRFLWKHLAIPAESFIGLSSDGVSAVNHYLVSQGCSTVKP
jgi:HTH-type transcriptional regulator / antitoxin HigA